MLQPKRAAVLLTVLPSAHHSSCLNNLFLSWCPQIISTLLFTKSQHNEASTYNSRNLSEVWQGHVQAHAPVLVLQVTEGAWRQHHRRGAVASYPLCIYAVVLTSAYCANQYERHQRIPATSLRAPNPLASRKYHHDSNACTQKSGLLHAPSA